MSLSLPQPTARSAVFAGIWSAMGLGLTEHLAGTHANLTVSQHNIVWLLAAIAFFFAPVFVFVLGFNRPLPWNWFLSPSERERYGQVVKRMLVWFLSAAAALAVVAPFTS